MAVQFIANVVPVNYVVGLDDNIVPVKTVGAPGVGVVEVKDVLSSSSPFGPVVPVREVITETPQVLVHKQ